MDVGYVLSNLPPIIENVFKYLSVQELDDCAEVCDLWKRIAETEKSRREDIALFFQVSRCAYHGAVHSSVSEECSLADVESGLSGQLERLPLKPAFCLAFASSSLVEDFEQLFPSFRYPPSKRLRQEDLVRKRAYMRAVVQTSVGCHLPSTCATTFCVARGVIGCDQEVEEGYAISGLLIPFVPGLRIFSWPVEEMQCDISQRVPEGVDIKCLLVFVTPYETSSYNRLIQSCLLRQNSKLALGGALVERSESGCGSAVAFCGRSVEAATVVIKPKDREAEVEKKLLQWAGTELLKGRCFAFMFSCVARGYFVYKRYNVESTVFHKLYPHIPLIGMFGNGEIGFDYLPNTSCQKDKNEVLRIGKLARCRKRYIHSYTTIFVLVSLKL